jgi:uncharacterized protein (DUF58 family)
MHRSAHFGASVDFAEHRGYTPGADIRRVDWKLFGRTDRFYIKEYEADTNSNFACLLDVSKSMAFRSRGITSSITAHPRRVRPTWSTGARPSASPH